jgi:transposase
MADRDGVAKVVQDLGCGGDFCKFGGQNVGKQGNPLDHKLQRAEMARLKRENIRLKEEALFKLFLIII